MTINAKEATALYNDNWDLEFTTMEDLYERIRVLSKNGCAQLCVYVDSKKQYDEVYDELSENDFNVEHYNGGRSSIIEVNWGI